MVVLGILLIGAAAGVMCFALGFVNTSDKKTRERLLATTGAVVKTESARDRLQAETADNSAKLVVTRGMLSKIEHNIVLAGRPDGWTIQNILVGKILLPVVLLFAMFKFSFSEFSLLRTGVGVAAVVLGYFVPDLLIQSRAAERQRAMEHQLPDALDKIVISIESGLGFEAALSRTAESGRGDLMEELVRTIQDIRVGMSRRDAYEALIGRTDSVDIRRFVRSIIQAEESGVSVSTVVRAQAKEMRVKRRLRAEGKAAQVSVKILFPLLVCIFPVLFVVVLAPGLMTTLSAFHNR